MDDMLKPPIGLLPLSQHKKKRLSDVKDAIKRYMDAELPLPEEWIQAYQDCVRTTVPLTQEELDQLKKDINKQFTNSPWYKM